MMGAGNISTAAWTLAGLQELAIRKAGDLGLNVTAELDGWAKKFAKCGLCNHSYFKAFKKKEMLGNSA